MLFSRSKSLTPTDAAAAMARGELQLIDVREPSELNEARFKGARHIPLGQLSAKLGELDRDPPHRVPLPVGKSKRDRHTLGHQSRA